MSPDQDAQIRTSQLPSSAVHVSQAAESQRTVHLDCEAAGVADGVGAASRAEHGREPNEERRLVADLGEDLGAGHVGERGVQLERAVGAGAASVHDALRDALVCGGQLALLTPVRAIEVVDLRRSAGLREDARTFSRPWRSDRSDGPRAPALSHSVVLSTPAPVCVVSEEPSSGIWRSARALGARRTATWAALS